MPPDAAATVRAMTATGQPATQRDATRQPRSPIASDRVIGTDVRRPDGIWIERLMLDEATGRVADAVMSGGGYLGLGEDFCTLP